MTLAYTDLEHVIISDDPTIRLDLDSAKSHGDPVAIKTELLKITGITDVAIDENAVTITITIDDNAVWDKMEGQVAAVLGRVLGRQIMFQTEWAMMVG